MLEYDVVKMCSSCLRRSSNPMLAEVAGTLRRWIEEEFGSGTVRVSSRPCFNVCPSRGMAVSLGNSEAPFLRDVREVSTYADCEAICWAIRGE